MDVLKLGIGRYAPGIVNAVIEIAKGSRKRYRYHRKRRNFIVDYRLMIPSPLEYGWIPETWTKGGKRLNILVLSRRPTWGGNVCEARLIGGVRRRDGDHQVIGVLMGDSRYDPIHDITDLDPRTVRRIVQFYEPFFPLAGWMSRTEVLEYVRASHENFQQQSAEAIAAADEAEERAAEMERGEEVVLEPDSQEPEEPPDLGETAATVPTAEPSPEAESPMPPGPQTPNPAQEANS